MLKLWSKRKQGQVKYSSTPAGSLPGTTPQDSLGTGGKGGSSGVHTWCFSRPEPWAWLLWAVWKLHPQEGSVGKRYPPSPYRNSARRQGWYTSNKIPPKWLRDWRMLFKDQILLSSIPKASESTRLEIFWKKCLGTFPLSCHPGTR